MTDPAPTLNPRNLDSQGLRRLALRLHAEGDYIVDAIRQDAVGMISPDEAHQLLEDSIAHTFEILRDLFPLQRMAVNAALSHAEWKNR